MTILVTGGAGYIGSQIAYRLVDLNYTPVILDDLSTGFREAVPAGVPLIVGSIEDLGLVRQLLREHRVEAVMHLAGSSVVEESMRDPIKYLRNNASATIALLQACLAENVSRFIFSSSASVYGSTSTGAIKEDAPKLPINPYGRSKLIAEMAIETLSEVTKLDFVVLRYFNVAGADPDLRTGHRGRNATTLVHSPARWRRGGGHTCRSMVRTIQRAMAPASGTSSMCGTSPSFMCWRSSTCCAAARVPC